jgi:hypothetical protein
LSLECSLALTLRHFTATRFQVALNVAIPACSLCINRRLYKVAKMKVMGMTDDEKRRAVVQDLLIGVGIPVLQMISRECLAIYCQPIVNRDVIQNTLFRRGVT